MVNKWLMALVCGWFWVVFGLMVAKWVVLWYCKACLMLFYRDFQRDRLLCQQLIIGALRK
jgi:hypothetical protein